MSKEEKDITRNTNNSDGVSDDSTSEMDSEEVVYDDESSPRDAMRKLREKLKKCEGEKQEYLDGWQRAKADFVNARRKNEEQRVDLIKNAGKNVLLQILPALDSFEMAFSNKDKWNSIDQEWRMGVEQIYGQLQRVLKDNEVQEIDPQGEEFDPNKHEAVEVVNVEDKNSDNSVVEVLQKGYEHNGSVLRTAKVRVGRC